MWSKKCTAVPPIVLTETLLSLGTRESEIFVHESNRRLRFEFESNLESNQGVVGYMFRSCVGLLHTAGNYLTACYVVM